MDPPSGGKSANESVCQTRVIQFEYWHMQQSQCRLTGRNFTQDPQLEASVFMTWIRTIPFAEADEKLRKAMDDQKSLVSAQ